MSESELLPAAVSAEIEVLRGSDGEPRVSAEALAVGLGYSRPRDILTTIRRLESEGALLGSVEWVTEVRAQPTGNGGTRGFEVETAHLTQAQALFVTARSKTANAAKITNLVISVFLAAQRGELARPSLGAVNTSNYERLLLLALEQIQTQSRQVERLLAHQTRQQNTPKAQGTQRVEKAHSPQAPLPLPAKDTSASRPSARVLRLSCLEWGDRDLWWPSEIAKVLREVLGQSYHAQALDRAAARLGWLDRYGDARQDRPEIVASRNVGYYGKISYRVRAQYVPDLVTEFARGLW